MNTIEFANELLEVTRDSESTFMRENTVESSIDYAIAVEELYDSVGDVEAIHNWVAAADALQKIMPYIGAPTSWDGIGDDDGVEINTTMRVGDIKQAIAALKALGVKCG